MLRKLLITVSVQECALPVPCARMPLPHVHKMRTTANYVSILHCKLSPSTLSTLPSVTPYLPCTNPMAPLHRSFSLPVSLSNPVSRLKALSGAAGKDEVSLTHTKGKRSPRSVYVTLIPF